MCIYVYYNYYYHNDISAQFNSEVTFYACQFHCSLLFVFRGIDEKNLIWPKINWFVGCWCCWTLFIPRVSIDWLCQYIMMYCPVWTVPSLCKRLVKVLCFEIPLFKGWSKHRNLQNILSSSQKSNVFRLASKTCCSFTLHENVIF